MKTQRLGILDRIVMDNLRVGNRRVNESCRTAIQKRVSVLFALITASVPRILDAPGLLSGIIFRAEYLLQLLYQQSGSDVCP